MNDPSQREIHKENGFVLEPEINKTDEGYQASCPTCPWTSGIVEFKGFAKIRYYRHLDYVERN